MPIWEKILSNPQDLRQFTKLRQALPILYAAKTAISLNCVSLWPYPAIDSFACHTVLWFFCVSKLPVVTLDSFACRFAATYQSCHLRIFIPSSFFRFICVAYLQGDTRINLISPGQASYLLRVGQLLNELVEKNALSTGLSLNWIANLRSLLIGMFHSSET